MEYAAIQEISTLLSDLVAAHQDLFTSVQAENQALVQADVSAVQKETAEKQKIIDRIRRIEVVRVSCMARLTHLWPKRPSDLSMSSLLQSIRDLSEQSIPGITLLRQSLEASFNSLMNLIPQITQQNTANQALVEKSLEHIQSMKQNLLGGSEPTSRTYSNEGKKITSSTSPRFVSREA